MMTFRSNLTNICALILLYTGLVLGNHDPTGTELHASHNQQQFGAAKPMRYLLYEVNPGEGFNLRRDVYMRIANLVYFLNEEGFPWTLVLPPWGQIYHWKSRYVRQDQLPWSKFFDVESLNRHIPVIEFTTYLRLRDEPVIDEVYYLQRYKEGWKSGKWEQKMDLRECIDDTGFNQHRDGRWHWWFWGYEDIYAKDFKCLSVQGQARSMMSFLNQNTSGDVLILRCETLLHDYYGQWSYWAARLSLVFAKHLRDVGDKFREEKLDSTNEKDLTVRDEDWTQMRRQHGDAVGGPYGCVHLRRRDFLYGHSKDVPSLKYAAQQITDVLAKYNLTTLFLATDAPKNEVTELRSFMPSIKVLQYKPTEEELNKYKDGGVAIIDQWICSHARYFTGTSQSTFSFRIQEEREIMGFDMSTTFNRLCGDNEDECEGPSKWPIKYD